MATPRQSAETADRLPPQNLEAERGVLGSLLLMNEAIDDVADVLRPDCFYHDAHQRIYAAISRLHEAGVRGIDPVTVAEELERNNELAQIGGAATLAEILEAVPHPGHVKYYAQIVREKWIKRRLIYACSEVLHDCYEDAGDPNELLQKAEQTIFRILEQQDNTERMGIGDILLDAFDRINDRLQAEGSISGLSTGFVDLDELTNGLQPSELVILAARPSMGKTALVCNIAQAAAETGAGVVIFSLEQSRLEIAERLLCIRAQVDGHRLRGGELSHEDHERLLEASAELSQFPLFIDDAPGRNMTQISAVCRRMKRRHEIRLVIIDYLQLIEPEDRGINREQQISQITRRLKYLAKEVDVPVIALAQLNRGVELREDKRPRLADLRESGAIEQDADLVMFLHRPEMYDPNIEDDLRNVAEVIVAKHRSGPTGIVRLTFRKESMRFENYSPLHDLPADLLA